GTIEDGAPDITPLIVGTKPKALFATIQPGGWQLRIHQIKTGLVIDVVRCQPGRQQRRQHEHHEHRKAEHGYLVPQEVVDKIRVLESSPTAWAHSHSVIHALTPWRSG